MVVMFVSCTEKEELHTEHEQSTIAFSSVEAEQEMMTRSATPLERDFVVYGYKNVNSSTQQVIDGYTVTYKQGSANTSEDNTHNYYYVNGTTQTIKYWDFGASEYRYWGYTGDKSHFTTGTPGTTDGTVLTIPVSGLLEAAEPTALPLFSSLYIRKPVTRDVVTLRFKHPYSMVRVLFYTSESMEADDEIILTDLKFCPDPAATAPLVNRVYSAGKVKVTYPIDPIDQVEHVEVLDLLYADGQDKLAYKDVTLSPTAGSALDNAVLAKTALTTDGTEFYYTLPMGEKNPAFILTVCVNGDTEYKTAVVPAAYMHWKPNYTYTYIFKITEAGKKIELFDVKIDPWHYGGSQDEEWKNW